MANGEADDERNWSDGKEQYADSKRKIVVKPHRAWKQACSAKYAANYDRIFGKRPTDEKAEP